MLSTVSVVTLIAITMYNDSIKVKYAIAKNYTNSSSGKGVDPKIKFWANGKKTRQKKTSVKSRKCMI